MSKGFLSTVGTISTAVGMLWIACVIERPLEPGPPPSWFRDAAIVPAVMVGAGMIMVGVAVLKEGRGRK